MPRRTAGLRGAVVVVALTVLGTTTPAHAGTYVHRDTTEDVVRIPRDGSACDDCQGTDRPDADILRFRADYGRKLRLTATLAELPDRGQVDWLLRFAPKRWVILSLARGDKETWQCQTLTSTHPRRPVSCAEDVRWRVDRRRSVFTALVPAHYVDDARSVRVGAGSLSYTGSDFYLDDALRAVYDPPSHGLAFVAGPSIPRG